MGIGYDGDADRIGAVDHLGNIIWGDQLMILFSREILSRHPGATIVSEVKCSQNLYDDIAKHGGRGIMWRAGHSLLKSKMKEEKALLGGEMSGHMFFADRYFGYDDAIYASCRLLEILSRTEKSIPELLSDVPKTSTTPEIRVDCPDDQKFDLVERVKESFRKDYPIVDVDGVRVLFPDGWGLVRASNTQPVLVLRFEAASPERLREIRSSGGKPGGGTKESDGTEGSRLRENKENFLLLSPPTILGSRRSPEEDSLGFRASPMKKMETFVVIMAGGGGTRFWPWSRETRPKQLLPILSERSMIRETVDRLRPFASPEKILVVTSRSQAAQIQEEVPADPEDKIFLSSPRGRIPPRVSVWPLSQSERSARKRSWSSFPPITLSRTAASSCGPCGRPQNSPRGKISL